MSERLSALKVPVKLASRSDQIWGQLYQTLHALGFSILKENGIADVLTTPKIKGLVKKRLMRREIYPTCVGKIDPNLPRK